MGDKFVKIDPGGSGEILNPGGTVIDTSLPLDIDDMIGKYIFGVMTKGENEKTG